MITSTILCYISFSSLVFETRRKGVIPFETKFVGYIPFERETDSPVGVKDLEERAGRLKPPVAACSKNVIKILLTDRQPGNLDSSRVRFVLRLKSGHLIAIDPEGGVRIDGVEFAIKESKFKKIKEIVEKLYPNG